MHRDTSPGSLARVLSDVAAEREAQDSMWGVQEFPDGTGARFAPRAQEARHECATAWSRGELTWRHVLTEEFAEAVAESDPDRLRTELVQTAAVAVKWVQALDRRHGTAAHRTREDGGRPEKLVRDRIPDIAARRGARPDTRTAGEAEYAALLSAKLYEEAGEYVSAGDPAELADLLEVVRALARTHGVDPAELERLRAAKAAERGGFNDRVVLRSPARDGTAHRPRIRHAARALLLDGGDLVLFRRVKTGRPPYWSTPGGKIERSDAGPQDALRRELDEELGATVGPMRHIFGCAEETPGLHYLSSFYVCRLETMDLARRHGPEFADPSKGRYEVERVPCTPQAIGAIDLIPAPLAGYLHAHAADLPGLLS